MRGYVTCDNCKGSGYLRYLYIFWKRCPKCGGLGTVWVDNIDKYFQEKEKDQQTSRKDRDLEHYKEIVYIAEKEVEKLKV